VFDERVLNGCAWTNRRNQQRHLEWIVDADRHVHSAVRGVDRQ
jgi:hypothetical protein